MEDHPLPRPKAIHPSRPGCKPEELEAYAPAVRERELQAKRDAASQIPTDAEIEKWMAWRTAFGRSEHL